MKVTYFFITIIFFFSCANDSIKNNISPNKPIPVPFNQSDTLNNITTKTDTCELEKKLIQAGLINIHTIDSTILVYLKYSDTTNFMKQDVYGDLCHAYLQPDVAQKLAQAQYYLKQEHPELSLLLLDGARPLSIQQKMWDMLDMPVSEKGKFVSNPKNHSLHNYGAAVDITLADTLGNELDMGTPYDYAGELAYPVLEQKMLAEGKLSRQQINNRMLLRKVMNKAGFFGIQTEWWHFNSCTRAKAKEIYTLIE
jgi:D-alanyl-D-alanine dipeptidase